MNRETTSAELRVCAVCGALLAPHLEAVKDPLTGEIFSVPKCSRCGLGHTLPRPEELGPYYPSVYYGNRHSLTEGLCARRRLRLLSAAVGATGHRGSLLDVGCGDGSFLHAARRAGWRVAGTERNPEPARARGLSVGRTLPEIEGEGPFDCITFWHSLEHMTDVKAALGEAAKTLKPNGRLLVAVPDFGGLQARLFGKHWVHVDVPRHLYHFDRRSLRVLFEQIGCRVEREWHQELEYDVIGWSQSLMNAFSSTPNAFFDRVTGKAAHQGRGSDAGLLTAGFVLSLLSLPAVALGTAMKRGGTLVMSAGRAEA